MRARTTLTVGSLILGCTAAVIVGGAPAGATSSGPSPYLSGSAGGTEVVALGGAVTSGLTGASGIGCTNTVGASNSNQTAGVSVTGLLAVSAVSSSIKSSAIPGGVQLAAEAKVAGVSALGGLITADGIDTTSVAKRVNGVGSVVNATTFVHLKIAGVQLPVTIRKNLFVSIPDVATIGLNYSGAYAGPDGAVEGIGIGMYITLLKAQGDSPAGTVIYLNPTLSAIGGSVLSPIGGFGYVTRVTSDAGGVVQVGSGPTAPLGIGCGGTGGKDTHNTTAGVNIPGVATTGVAETTARGTANGRVAYARMSVQVAGVNLFGGLITAKALSGTATAYRNIGQPVATTTTTEHLVALVIAGKRIPVNVSPNTVINVAGLGNVVINGQYRNATTAYLRVLDIKLSTGRFGLPIGAEIQVGVAAAIVYN